jgi:hypothetical protein
LDWGATVFLTQAWPYDQSDFQQWAFSFMLLGCCYMGIGLAIILLKTWNLVRPRPQRATVETQKAHGAARLASESEAQAALRSKH